ncbi:MAG: HAD-IC family P-type ATPase, partial [Lentisphaeria bacterium]|nr:HAD-IC family P-type ATPase [Lentisphaeria bacterium]
MTDQDDEETDIPARDLQKGQIVRVRSGERIPADGVLTDGNAYVDESMLTGESTPVQKHVPDKVIGGSINLNGSFLYRVTHTGKESVVARIIDLVRTAQGSKPPVARIADLVSGYFVWGVMTVSLVTFSVWFWFLGSPLWNALEFALSVLVVAC